MLYIYVFIPMYNLLIKAFKWMVNICMFDAFELRFTLSLTGIIHSIPFDKQVSYLLSFPLKDQECL